jgi:hypothetical protein
MTVPCTVYRRLRRAVDVVVSAPSEPAALELSGIETAIVGLAFEISGGASFSETTAAGSARSAVGASWCSISPSDLRSLERPAPVDNFASENESVFCTETCASLAPAAVFQRSLSPRLPVINKPFSAPVALVCGSHCQPREYPSAAIFSAFSAITLSCSVVGAKSRWAHALAVLSNGCRLTSREPTSHAGASNRCNA